jgi:hypothetical protein
VVLTLALWLGLTTIFFRRPAQNAGTAHLIAHFCNYRTITYYGCCARIPLHFGILSHE